MSKSIVNEATVFWDMTIHLWKLISFLNDSTVFFTRKYSTKWKSHRYFSKYFKLRIRVNVCAESSRRDQVEGRLKGERLHSPHYLYTTSLLKLGTRDFSLLSYRWIGQQLKISNPDDINTGYYKIIWSSSAKRSRMTLIAIILLNIDEFATNFITINNTQKVYYLLSKKH